MRQLIKRRIGQILLNGRFMSNRELDRALEEQKNTNELLGQVLVRMGVIKERDFKVPLVVQEHLSHIDDAVKIAAGERQLLGVLLVRSGHITNEQLDYAILEQKRSGEKLGEVFVRLGMLTELQITALLDFQKNQSGATSGPLRLGELLVATGHISRMQLDEALRKQALTHKKLGEVLVDEGYVRPSLVNYGICMQRMLVNSVLAGIISLGMGATSFASSVVLQWDPTTDTSVSGYRVYSSPGTSTLEDAVPMDVQKQTTATVSGLDPEKSYNFAVTAYNASGVESPFSNIVSVAEQSAPTVAIASPANSISVSGTVSISVNAADNVGVTKVEFYVNGVLKATDTGTPYVYSWDTSSLAPGAYTLMAKAYDAAGNVGQSATSTVTVVNDVTAPTVAVTAPVNNAIVSGTVTLSSSASDNVGVSKVEFYANNVLLFASNVSPYSTNWDTRAVANGNYTIIAKAYDNAGNSKQSSSVTVTVNNVVADATAPTLSSFTLPATSTSLTVPVSGLTASDNVGVTGYMITESSTKPAATASGWSSTAPASFTFSSTGTKTAYAWAKDAAGNVSGSRSASVTITVPDATAPTLSSFTLPATSTSLTVPVSGLTASDNVGVTGYLITESSTKPAATASGWSSTAPASFTFSSTGTKTAYAWAKDAAGNVSGSRSASVTITVPDATAPTLSSFTLPATSTSLTVPVSGLTASDNVGVTGYLITESSTKPAAAASGWSSAKPASFTFSSTGTKTAYAWAKDAAGNVSGSRSASVTITVPDATAPTLSSFTLPATSTSLTVPVSGLTASDNVGVTGYLITESSTKPAAAASGWSSAKPASFTFSSTGTKTAYAWAKDAAGNVSGSRSASVTITAPDVAAPTLSSFTLPAIYRSLTVPVYGLTASDNRSVTGYLITESSTKPSAGASGWSSTAPASFTFSSAGTKTAYAWAKDAAGNVSGSRSASVYISLYRRR